MKEVRAALILKDSNLSKWAAANGVKRQNVSKALLGEWIGPKAEALVLNIIHETLE